MSWRVTPSPRSANKLRGGVDDPAPVASRVLALRGKLDGVDPTTVHQKRTCLVRSSGSERMTGFEFASPTLARLRIWFAETVPVR
jgi:hypothetical protein